MLCVMLIWYLCRFFSGVSLCHAHYENPMLNSIKNCLLCKTSQTILKCVTTHQHTNFESFFKFKSSKWGREENARRWRLRRRQLLAIGSMNEWTKINVVKNATFYMKHGINLRMNYANVMPYAVYKWCGRLNSSKHNFQQQKLECEINSNHEKKSSE